MKYALAASLMLLRCVTYAGGAGQEIVSEFDVLVAFASQPSNTSPVVSVCYWTEIEHADLWAPLLSSASNSWSNLVAHGIAPTAFNGWYVNQPSNTWTAPDKGTKESLGILRNTSSNLTVELSCNAAKASLPMLLSSWSEALGCDLIHKGKWQMPIAIHSPCPLDTSDIVDLLEIMCMLADWQVRHSRTSDGRNIFVIHADESQMRWRQVQTVFTSDSGQTFYIQWTSESDNGADELLQQLKHRVERRIDTSTRSGKRVRAEQ